jgi:hypothetical protein
MLQRFPESVQAEKEEAERVPIEAYLPASARAKPTSMPPLKRMWSMRQTLLADRFKL